MTAQLALPLSGDALRDEGLAVITENSRAWMDLALALLPQMSRERVDVTGEDIHLWIESRIGPPHHHNAWGPLVRTAAMLGILEFTDCYRKFTSPVRHAHRTPVYRFAG